LTLVSGGSLIEASASFYSLLSPLSCSIAACGGNRRSPCDVERAPVAFLSWFFDPSLQRALIEELMAVLLGTRVGVDSLRNSVTLPASL